MDGLSIELRFSPLSFSAVYIRRIVEPPSVEKKLNAVHVTVLQYNPQPNCKYDFVQESFVICIGYIKATLAVEECGLAKLF